jgi:hypothetical protein
LCVLIQFNETVLRAEQNPDCLFHSFLNSEILSASSDGLTAVPKIHICWDAILRPSNSWFFFFFCVFAKERRHSTSASGTWQMKAPRSFATWRATHNLLIAFDFGTERYWVEGHLLFTHKLSQVTFSAAWSPCLYLLTLCQFLRTIFALWLLCYFVIAFKLKYKKFSLGHVAVLHLKIFCNESSGVYVYM